MSVRALTRPDAVAAPDVERAPETGPRPRRRSTIGTALRVSWGASMAIIVGHDGSWFWISVRVLVVALGLVALIWVTGRDHLLAPVAIPAGLVGIVAGAGVGLPRLVDGDDVFLALAGIVALVAGLHMVIIAVVDLLRRRRRRTQILGATGSVVLLGLVALTFVPAVMATNAPRPELGDETPADFGLEYETVTFTSADGVQLAAWYVPSQNGAAVVVRHGAGSTRDDVLPQAAVVARHGYGVLLTDARGHGDSEGRAMDFGWYGDEDTAAAVGFLTGRADVDPARIGVIGMSMGGEEAIGAAAADGRIRAVVAEGVTARTDADTSWLSDVYGARGAVQEGIEWLRFALTDLMTDADKPITLREAIEQSPDTAFLVIAGGNMPDERHVLDHLAASGPANLRTWTVPDAGHTDGIVTEPAEWERRVVTFLDEHLAPSA